jgi:hypothetical protein
VNAHGEGRAILGSRYRSGRSPDLLKSKNPDAPAVKREGSGDGGAVQEWRPGCVLQNVERLLNQPVDRDAAFKAWGDGYSIAVPPLAPR